MANDDEAMALPVSMISPVRLEMTKNVAGNRLTASKGLEDSLLDDTVVVDLDLQLHYVATCGSSDKTGSNVQVLLVE